MSDVTMSTFIYLYLKTKSINLCKNKFVIAIFLLTILSEFQNSGILDDGDRSFIKEIIYFNQTIINRQWVLETGFFWMLRELCINRRAMICLRPYVVLMKLHNGPVKLGSTHYYTPLLKLTIWYQQ